MYTKQKTVMWSSNTPYLTPLTIYNKQHFKAKIKNIEYDSILDRETNNYKVSIYSGLTGSYNNIVLTKDDNTINNCYFINTKDNTTNFPVIKKNGTNNKDLYSDVYRDNIDKGNFYLDLNNGRYHIWNGNNYNAISLNNTGATENRPNNPIIGDIYFDTTIGRSIWWTGTKWVDSEGNDADSIPIISGTFANKPTGVDIGYAYFCTDKQTTEGATNGIMIYYKGNKVWVDALGRVVS